MVYQQFINYPNFTVFENIASPLRVAGAPAAEIKAKVGRTAELLRLTPMLDRRPAELSGGQQQRTAIARALVKDSDLILLDEPLANLDYKLREELRDELPRFFEGERRIVVYATTEPTEALLFGGNTATLHEGRITQFGPTAETYRRPSDLVTAEVFSDPPINTASVRKSGGEILIGDTIRLPAGTLGARVPDGDYTIGIRPHHISPVASDGTGALEGRVIVAELSGSESVVHFDLGGRTWVSQSRGIHPFEVGSLARLFVDVDQGFFFDRDGRFVAGGGYG
jgi:glycerol transport system ATP-binding protein